MRSSVHLHSTLLAAIVCYLAGRPCTVAQSICVSTATDHALAVLQVEAGTPFARWQAAGRLSFPDDEAGADMYRDASNLLRQVLLLPHCPGSL
jgi:hypothetical protein